MVQTERSSGDIKPGEEMKGGKTYRSSLIKNRGSILQNVAIKYHNLPPNVKPLRLLCILPPKMLYPNLRVHEANRTQKDLLLQLLQTWIVGQYRRGRLER